MPSATELSTIVMMREGGGIRIPVDTRMGQLDRPQAQATGDGRTATLETLFEFWINNVDDPDTALAQDPNFDERARQNPDVHAAAAMRELTVASFPWLIAPSDEQDVDEEFAQEVANYVNAVFKRLDTPELYRQMQESVLKGGVGHEWIWKQEGKGVAYPIHFYPVDKTRFLFDRLGNMALKTRWNPVWGAYVSTNPDSGFRYKQLAGEDSAIYFPEGKFTYHKYSVAGGTWTRPAEEGYLYYGRGENTRIYTLITFAGFALRFWMKWLEKYGIPPTDLYYPENQATSASIIAIANSVRGDSIATIPRPVGTGTENDYWNVKTREVPSLSFDAFNTFLNEFIARKIRSILLGSADEGDKIEGGGYSDHVSRRDAGPQILFRHDALRISSTLNTQFIPHICYNRWGNSFPSKYLPKHKMEPKEEKDQVQLLEVITQAAALVPVKEDDVYAAAGLDKPSDEDATVFNGMGVGGDDLDPFESLSKSMLGGKGKLKDGKPKGPRKAIGQGGGKQAKANKGIEDGE